jgi:hypothetical protein
MTRAPGRLAQLDRAAADAARGRVHQQGLAGRQPGPPVQPEPPGLVRDEERARLGVVQAGRGGQRAGRVHQRQLGEGAADRAADEPVAGRDPGHPGPAATTSPHSSTPGVNGSGGRTW